MADERGYALITEGGPAPGLIIEYQDAELHGPMTFHLSDPPVEYWPTGEKDEEGREIWTPKERTYE